MKPALAQPLEGVGDGFGLWSSAHDMPTHEVLLVIAENSKLHIIFELSNNNNNKKMRNRIVFSNSEL